MLTLGLMEGLFLLTIIALVFVGLGEAPLHRILGPLGLVGLALVTIGVVAADLTLTAGQLGGIVVFGVTGFLLPVIVMRTAWRSGRTIDVTVTEPAVVEHSFATVIVHPLRHHRLHRRSHRHAA